MYIFCFAPTYEPVCPRLFRDVHTYEAHGTVLKAAASSIENEKGSRVNCDATPPPPQTERHAQYIAYDVLNNKRMGGGGQWAVGAGLDSNALIYILCTINAHAFAHSRGGNVGLSMK